MDDCSLKGTVLPDMDINPPEQLPIEDISSPLSAQIFDLYDPDQLFPEQLQNSEVTSSSNCCYVDNPPYLNLSFPPDVNNPPNRSAHKCTITTTTNDDDNNNLSAIFDSPEEIDTDISASIDFSPFFSTNQQGQFDPSSLQSQNPLADSSNNNIVNYGLSHVQYPHPDPVVLPLVGRPPIFPSSYEEECLSLIPSYTHMSSSSPSCSFLEPIDTTIGPYLPSNLSAALCAHDNSGIFGGSMYMGNEMQQHHELEFQGDNSGIFCPETLPRIYNSCELQALSNESQHVNGGGSSTLATTDISAGLDDSSAFKVGKLTVEQRKEKIHRYMKKRNERNFSKKIKYACRKTLADSRPRVRGRFAKNDEFTEISRATCSNHEEDTDEDSLQVVVKEEEDMIDCSDIFAHISGVNSFKCNYPIQSWI